MQRLCKEYLSEVYYEFLNTIKMELKYLLSFSTVIHTPVSVSVSEDFFTKFSKAKLLAHFSVCFISYWTYKELVQK